MPCRCPPLDPVMVCRQEPTRAIPPPRPLHTASALCSPTWHGWLLPERENNIANPSAWGCNRGTRGLRRICPPYPTLRVRLRPASDATSGECGSGWHRCSVSQPRINSRTCDGRPAPMTRVPSYALEHDATTDRPDRQATILRRPPMASHTPSAGYSQEATLLALPLVCRNAAGSRRALCRPLAMLPLKQVRPTSLSLPTQPRVQAHTLYCCTTCHQFAPHLRSN